MSMTNTTNAKMIPVSLGASLIPWYPEYAREIDGWKDSDCVVPLRLIKAVTVRLLEYDMFLLFVVDGYEFPIVNVVTFASDGLSPNSIVIIIRIFCVKKYILNYDVFVENLMERKCEGS